MCVCMCVRVCTQGEMCVTHMINPRLNVIDNWFEQQGAAIQIIKKRPTCTKKC